MKHSRILPLIASFGLLTIFMQGEESESKVPYDAVSYAMSALKGQMIDGVECIPFYLRSTNQGEAIDPKKANFRIRMTDGKEVSLKVGLLSAIPEESRTDIDKKYLDDGYTHILWVPKADKRFLNGHLVISLPKGSVEMSQAFLMLQRTRTLEQAPAKPSEQPATAPESKPENKDQAQPESKPAPADHFKEEAKYLGLLLGLQFVETTADLKKLIPNCPPPQAYAGEDNTEIEVKTKLFGVDAKGEFHFHKGILVSHGFEVLTANYQEAHRVFLEAVAILDQQADDLKLSAALPTALDGADSSDGPRDEISIRVEGTDKNASFGLGLDMRQESTRVRWWAQKVSISKESPIEQAPPSGEGKPSN